jgi:hypothetical protein
MTGSEMVRQQDMVVGHVFAFTFALAWVLALIMLAFGWSHGKRVKVWNSDV